MTVLPWLPLNKYEHKKKFTHYLKVSSAIVIGPGLGRDIGILKDFGFILENLAGKIVVCDADFFWFFGQDIKMFKKQLKNVKRLIFTLNVLNFCRLFKIVTGNEMDICLMDELISENEQNQNEFEIIDLFSKFPLIKKFFDFFENESLIIIIKLKFDLIISKDKTFLVKTVGSNKRCVGIGDLLTGVLAQMAQLTDNSAFNCINSVIFSCYLLKRASFRAFKNNSVSLVTSDVLNALGSIVDEYFLKAEELENDEFVVID